MVPSSILAGRSVRSITIGLNGFSNSRIFCATFTGSRAVVVLVTEWMGQHIYRWDAKTDALDPEKPTPITEWTFEGGPRDFR